MTRSLVLFTFALLMKPVTAIDNGDVTNSLSDVDECRLGRSNCPRQTRCVNTEGGFICEPYQQDCPQGQEFNSCTGSCQTVQQECDPGYGLNVVSLRCEDIDECAIRKHKCTATEKCVNTIGSYNCRRIFRCGIGYTLQEETQQCVDINECDSGTHNCRGLYRCENMDGSYVCIPECPEGYRLSVSAERCEKI